MLIRTQRITSSADYARLFTGATTGHGQLVVVKALPAETSRAGIVVSKKTAPLAVDRNRIKRRLRAILRKELPTLSPSCDLVVIAKAPARQADSAALADDFLTAWAMVQKRIRV